MFPRLQNILLLATGFALTSWKKIEFALPTATLTIRTLVVVSVSFAITPGVLVQASPPPLQFASAISSSSSTHNAPHDKKINVTTTSIATETTTEATATTKSSTNMTIKNYQDAVVPFGGSAPRVPNPNKDILGGKGLGLQEMSSIGIDVPPGFTLITELCQVFDQHGDLPAELWALVDQAVERVERDMGRKFGDASSGAQPLLFSCRSGAKISMPGMMDTVLNVGLNKETVQGMAKATGNPRFAFDAYRRLLVSFFVFESDRGYCLALSTCF